MGKVIKMPERVDPLAPARGIVVGVCAGIICWVVIILLWIHFA